MNKPDKPQRRRPTRLFRLYMRDVKRNPLTNAEEGTSQHEPDEGNNIPDKPDAEEESHDGGN